MGSVLQGQIVWTGFAGAPGYTSLFNRFAGVITTNVDNMMTAMNDFAFAISSAIPSSVHLTPSTEIKQFDEATGVLIGLHTPVPVPVDRAGTASAPFAASTGACISWGTSGINRGKRVRGRSFIVPLAVDQYDAAGTLGSGCLATLNAAATGWRTSSATTTVVWSRPRLGAGGAAFDIESHHVTDQAAVLRSRRD